MKHTPILITLLCALACGTVTGCRSGNGSVWDENRTAGNYKSSTRSLWGKEDTANEDFFAATLDEDFIGLKDEDLHIQVADGAVPQPKHSPGDAGSRLPGIEGFHSPVGTEGSIFQTVYFGLDDFMIRGKEYTAIINNISDYMKSHSDTYIFVAGHCDERGPEAYNLSLGARRANSIRSLLVQKGVDPERIHTVSYGKERPADLGHNQDAWSKNRRGEFRIYKK